MAIYSHTSGRDNHDYCRFDTIQESHGQVQSYTSGREIMITVNSAL